MPTLICDKCGARYPISLAYTPCEIHLTYFLNTPLVKGQMQLKKEVKKQYENNKRSGL
jgi:hypothetical protein